MPVVFYSVLHEMDCGILYIMVCFFIFFNPLMVHLQVLEIRGIGSLLNLSLSPMDFQEESSLRIYKFLKKKGQLANFYAWCCLQVIGDNSSQISSNEKTGE